MEEPKINLAECTGCQSCVEDCPTDVFEMEADDKAHVVEPENCIDCHVCEDVCPTHAVHLVAA